MRALDAYLLPITSARRANPHEGIITALAQAEEEGDQVDRTRAACGGCGQSVCGLSKALWARPRGAR